MGKLRTKKKDEKNTDLIIEGRNARIEDRKERIMLAAEYGIPLEHYTTPIHDGKTATIVRIKINYGSDGKPNSFNGYGS